MDENRQSDEHRAPEVSAGLPDDFVSNPDDASAPPATMIVDPLALKTVGKRNGGLFVPKIGWKVTGWNDRIIFDVGQYLQSGSFEITIINFNPPVQRVWGETNGKKWPHRHHFLHANHCPGLDHHSLDTESSGWVLHSYEMNVQHRDLKQMNFRKYPDGLDYEQSVEDWSDTQTKQHRKWDPKHSYHFRIIWRVATAPRQKGWSTIFLDGVQQVHIESPNFQPVRYFAVGSDLTHSIDRETKLPGNRYSAIIGPIYSNLKIIKGGVS